MAIGKHELPEGRLMIFEDDSESLASWEAKVRLHKVRVLQRSASISFASSDGYTDAETKSVAQVNAAFHYAAARAEMGLREKDYDCE